MATTFSNLHIEASLKVLDEFLAGKNFVPGNQLTKDDVKVHAAVLEQPSTDLYPNASQWYQFVSSKLASSFPGKAAGVRIDQDAAAEVALAVEAKETPVVEDDDDFDLFGDETGEEKKALKQREAAKASTKKKESGKSSVLMDIKPWDDETDMKKLEEEVHKVEKPGLLWGTSKPVPVG